MSEVNENLTRKVAKLAKIPLSQEEAQKFARQIDEILAYVAQLKNVEVEGVEPMRHPFEERLGFRPDEVDHSRTPESQNKILQSSDNSYLRGFKVPQILQ